MSFSLSKNGDEIDFDDAAEHDDLFHVHFNFTFYNSRHS